jgi:hypothetical protein
MVGPLPLAIYKTKKLINIRTGNTVKYPAILLPNLSAISGKDATAKPPIKKRRKNMIL